MLLINKSYLQVFLFYLLTLNQKNKTLYIVFEEKPSFIFLKYVSFLNFFSLNNYLLKDINFFRKNFLPVDKLSRPIIRLFFFKR